LASPSPLPKDDLKDDASRLEVLKRQVETKVTVVQDKSDRQLTTFSKLVSLASPSEKALMYTGWVCAFIAGLFYPIFTNFLSRIFNAFGQQWTREETLHRVSIVFYIMLGTGLAVGLFGYMNNFFGTRFGALLTRRTKEQYFAAILKQDTAWFDSFNYNELSARINRETTQINKAVGEKVNRVVFAVGMTISGVLIGFINGWSLALVMLVIAPIIWYATNVFG
jgi:ATP-binding cassette, subfamily B (MDR/TAP), member 1